MTVEMTHMPTLTFEIKKRGDADAMLVLTRDDGSRTTNEIGPAQGYGPVHDLTHYVIESTLGLTQGFLGLVASGWNISDFEVKGTARRLPPEAMLAECAAGELSRQEMMQQYSTAEDFRWAIELLVKDAEGRAKLATVTDDVFENIRAQLQALRSEWMELPIGGTLTRTLRIP